VTSFHFFYFRVASKRVIIRQGHDAENFYFILSGTAVATKLIENEDGTAETKVDRILSKGDSFGVSRNK